MGSPTCPSSTLELATKAVVVMESFWVFWRFVQWAEAAVWAPVLVLAMNMSFAFP